MYCVILEPLLTARRREKTWSDFFLEVDDEKNDVPGAGNSFGGWL